MSNEISCNYKSNYYAKTTNVRKNTTKKDTVSTVDSKADISTEKSSPSKKSTENYYNELCQKFKDLNISIGNYTKGSQAGSGFGNLMISPEYLRKAANDPKIASKLEKDISGIPDAEIWLKNMCKMQGSTLTASGTIIDKDGNMSGWSCSRRTSGTKNDSIASSKSKESDSSKVSEKSDKSTKRTRTDDKTEQIKMYNQYNSILNMGSFNFFNTKI